MDKLQPLHVASAKGFTSVVEVLLQAGCSVHARDVGSGHSPLFLAAKNEHTATAQLLRNAGAHLKEDEVALARFLVQQHELRQQAPGTVPRSSDYKAVWELAGVSFA